MCTPFHTNIWMVLCRNRFPVEEFFSPKADWGVPSSIKTGLDVSEHWMESLSYRWDVPVSIFKSLPDKPPLTSVKLHRFRCMELTYKKEKQIDGVKASAEPESCTQDCVLLWFEGTLRKSLSCKERRMSQWRTPRLYCWEIIMCIEYFQDTITYAISSAKNHSRNTKYDLNLFLEGWLQVPKAST